MSRSNGYAPAHGHVYAREAVAKKYSLQDRTVTAEDVILANGCSEALKFIIHCIVGEGDNLLVPFPGFTLYITVHSIFFSIVHSCQNYQSHSFSWPRTTLRIVAATICFPDPSGNATLPIWKLWWILKPKH
jgi:aspartate/methionine/tyrosine aminotransferase